MDHVGTQGQFWMVLVSHGIGGTVCFVGWFFIATALSLRRTDPVGLASNTVLVVGSVELFYYGALPYGLPVLMTAAALALGYPRRQTSLGRLCVPARTGGRSN
jgi:hypothetical protein